METLSDRRHGRVHDLGDLAMSQLLPEGQLQNLAVSRFQLGSRGKDKLVVAVLDNDLAGFGDTLRRQRRELCLESPAAFIRTAMPENDAVGHPVQSGETR